MKKYFYVLRPLLAAKWILDKKIYPPMEFSKLLNEELKNDEKVKVWKYYDNNGNLKDEVRHSFL